MEIKNKLALITGGTHGIGAQTALQLAAEGVKLSIVARNADATEIEKKIKAMGGECIVIAADLAKPEECTRVVNETIQRMGDIDILVHSAGSAAPGSLLNVSEEVWYNAFNIHIHAAFHLCRAAVPSMKKKKGGVIIFISSAAGVRGVKNALSYAVVKGALPAVYKGACF